MIHSFKPELATLVNAVPLGNEWLHEIKFDGYRIIAFIDKKNIRLVSRNGKDWTEKFSTIVKAIKELNISQAVLDGELVVLDKKGRSQFQLLQNAIDQDTFADLHYFVFDLPFFENKNLSKKPLLERKKILKKILAKAKNTRVHYSEHIQGNGKKIFSEACKKGLEGIISKKADSIYKQRRSEDWLKIKNSQQQEFIIVGFTAPQGERKYFGSLLLGYYHNNSLIYCGHVGTGFNQKILAQLYKKLSAIKQNKSPIKHEITDALNRKVIWVKPLLVAEVEFSEWTNDGILRHPVFKGLRNDKSAVEVINESSKEKLKSKKIKDKKNIALTHPNKQLYLKEKITKLDLWHYYEKVADHLFPYIKNRPLTLLRCPNPGFEKCFYQRNWTTGLPKNILAIQVPTKKETKQFLMVNNKKSLLEIVQLDILELHPWLSLKDKLNYPNQIIFDLDPSPDVNWKTLVNAAKIFHTVLKKLNLIGFVKLTGGKGLHIVIPIRRIYDFSTTKYFAKELGKYVMQQFPELFTMNLKKESRKNKIFIDYLRNDYGATAIACFSPRARENASIAVPISWEKLGKTKKPLIYTIKTIDSYFKDFANNPWSDFFHLSQTLPE